MPICPICQSEAKPLDRTGDAEGFDCPQHERFKVGGTALSTKSDASREQWEAALKKAKASSEGVLFYSPRMTEAVAQNLALENMLRHHPDRLARTARRGVIA